MDLLIEMGDWFLAMAALAGLVNLAALLALGHTKPRRPL